MTTETPAISEFVTSYLPDGSVRCQAGTISFTAHNHGRCTRRTRVTLVDIADPSSTNGQAIPLCAQHRRVYVERADRARQAGR